jgi:AAA domain
MIHAVGTGPQKRLSSDSPRLSPIRNQWPAGLGVAAQPHALTNRSDLERVWRDTASRYGFGPDEGLGLLAGERPWPVVRGVEDRIEQRLTEHHAVFELRDLNKVALEQTAGILTPHEALGVAQQMVRDRRVLTLEGGRMTTLEVRAQEQAIGRRATTLARPSERDVGHTARTNAVREVAERIGAPLTDEQDLALLVLTGPERASVLVGPAGTGKGVVIDSAARAEQLAGHETLGIAVSGSTAERLGTDSPALQGSTLTLDALVARANTGTLNIGPDTTIFLDEAGMVDHKRLDALTRLVERSGGKLIAVGDGEQLPSIGPGGMFDRLTRHAPTVELGTIHRTTTRMSKKRGKRYAQANPNARWRTTKPRDNYISQTLATRPPRTPSKSGHNSPRKSASVMLR